MPPSRGLRLAPPWSSASPTAAGRAIGVTHPPLQAFDGDRGTAVHARRHVQRSSRLLAAFPYGEPLVEEQLSASRPAARRSEALRMPGATATSPRPRGRWPPARICDRAYEADGARGPRGARRRAADPSSPHCAQWRRARRTSRTRPHRTRRRGPQVARASGNRTTERYIRDVNDASACCGSTTSRADRTGDRPRASGDRRRGSRRAPR
jgi:hypothetical protein